MLITQKDVDKLKSLDFHPFKFIYNNTEAYDKNLHNKVIEYFKNKGVLGAYEQDLQENKLQCLIFKEKDKEYQKEFLNSFVGQDIKELEGFFINYAISNVSDYFERKEILAMDKITRHYYLYLRQEITENNYFIVLKDQCEYPPKKDIFLTKVDLNRLYKHHIKVFQNLNKDKLYQKYQSKMKKWTKGSSAIFYHTVAGIIAYKRPFKELEDFLSTDSNLKKLRDPDFNNFYKSLDKTVMPEILNIIDNAIEKSEKFNNEKISFVQNLDLKSKVFELELDKLSTKYQLKTSDCYKLVLHHFELLSEIINIKYYGLEDENSDKEWIHIYGKEEKINLFADIFSDIINDTRLFNNTSIKQTKEYIKVAIEKKTVLNGLTVSNNLEPRKTHKI